MERIEFSNTRNQGIVGILEKISDNKEIVVILHGFSANKDGGPRVMAEVMAQRGINSFRIDLDNQGESEPEIEKATITSYKDTVLSAINEMKKKGFEKIDLLGTSFGGAVALAVANEIQINKMVLRAPALDHYEWMLERYGKTELAKSKEKGYFEYQDDDGKIYKMDYEWVEDGKLYSFDKVKNISCPIMIIHGTADESVDYQDSVNKVSQFPNAELITIEGAGHHLGVNGDWSESLNALVNFLK